MKISREKQWQFLEEELKAETEDFKKKFESPAKRLLDEDREMFVAIFESFHNGSMVARFPNSRSIPRKGGHFLCMLLPKEFRLPSKWDEKTYRDLYAIRLKSTDCVCIYHAKSNDPNYSVVGFSGVDVEFARLIENAKGVALVFAPQFPPLEYVANLQKLTKDNKSKSVSDIFDVDYKRQVWSPRLIREDCPSKVVLSQMELTPITVLQGPPGTGKTYTIAEICAALCAEGKSVLVTALTNRALMETASKPALTELLAAGKISKVHLTIDEAREVKGLRNANSALPAPGEMLLATFYMSSGYASDTVDDGLFDVVIVDEASQAFMAMFAAASKLGKRNLWVGDVNQLPPVVMLNADRIKDSGYEDLVDGFRLISCNREYPVMQLTKTYRLGERATAFTGIFYEGTLVSAQDNSRFNINGLENLAREDGGPVLLPVDMAVGDNQPKEAIARVLAIVKSVLSANPKKKIAVLAHKVKTVVAIQKAKASILGDAGEVIVETVARIQGLTTDIVIFIVPNAGYHHGLERRLFNVATSRAKEHTIVIADRSIMEHKELDSDVRRFLEKLLDEYSSVVAPIADIDIEGDALDNQVRPLSSNDKGNDNDSPLKLSDLQDLLDSVQLKLCKWLEYYLVKACPRNTWENGVMKALLPEQRENVLYKGTKVMSGLDFPELVSVFVANIKPLMRESHLDREAPDLLKHIKKIRNKYAHKDSEMIETPSQKDLKFHVDTIHRFMELLGEVPSNSQHKTVVIRKNGITISAS